MLSRCVVRNRICLTALLLSGSCALLAFRGTDDNDWLIVPGKRVGPITAAATHADLAKIFGAKNIQDDEIVTSDMGSEDGTRVFGDQPEISLAIFWLTEAANSHIRRIRFCPSLVMPHKCRWHTAEGISLGTSLKELERLNGHAFEVNGFDWGFGGLIVSWHGGRLEKLTSSCGGLNVRLDPQPGQPSGERSRLLDLVEGDEDFDSSEAAMQALNPIVDFISFSFQNCKGSTR
ncbi:MAG TPA: hypothetical protein VFA65_01705 [Bryobacteraceae bacterium]|nr:hypothetical protein [Bryobacteraceae bacterium]